MSHYTKNVQSLLTGGFKILNVIFKNKFRVKDNTKELCFSDYFYRCFPQKNVGGGGGGGGAKTKQNKKTKKHTRTVDGNEYRLS